MSENKIFRKIDELGRIAIPKEFREKIGIKEKDTVEVYIKDNKLVICKQNYE